MKYKPGNNTRLSAKPTLWLAFAPISSVRTICDWLLLMLAKSDKWMKWLTDCWFRADIPTVYGILSNLYQTGGKRFYKLYKVKLKGSCGAFWTNRSLHFHQNALWVSLRPYNHTHITMQNNTENMTMTLITFCGLFCVILVIDGPLTFLDFLIMQGAVVRMIILDVHIAQPCLHSCMIN